MDPDFDRAPVIGATFAGRYRIERHLGSGGMGTVVAAIDNTNGQPVALKILRGEHARTPALVKRFLREEKAVRRLASEHVVRVLDARTEGEVPFLVMELLDGADLAAVLRAKGQLSLDLAIRWIDETCAGLEAAHAAGIVHRDLKPANLFVVGASGEGRIKILDFGVSKFAEIDADLGVTTTSTVMGTPRYMSPEQLKASRDVDARTDVWALGAIFFELLAGRPPFLAETVAELGVQVLTEDAPDLGRYVDDLPPAVAEVVATCLRRSPADRYPSVTVLRAALASIVADVASPTPRPLAIERRKVAPRRRGTLALALVGIALAGGGGTVAALRARPRGGEDASPPVTAEPDPPSPGVARTELTAAPVARVEVDAASPPVALPARKPHAARPKSPSASPALTAAPPPRPTPPEPPATNATDFSKDRHE